MKQIFPIFLLLLVFFSSCSKEGATGPQGFPGEDGKDGKNTTGSHLYYFNIPINQFNKVEYYYDDNQYYNDAWVSYGYIEGITIQETDLVLVFMHQTNDGGPDNYFQALPYNDYFDNSEDFNHYSYGTMDDNGDLIFTIRRNNGNDPFNDMNATWEIEYNIYIIEGTKDKKAELPSYINTENEREIKEFLNIKKYEKNQHIQGRT